MKKILLAVLFCICFAGNGNAQAQNQVQIIDLSQEQTQIQDQQSYIYCKVSFLYVTLRGKCDIYVDFGQFESKLLPDTMNMVCGIEEFNSEMAALNWLSRHGWELYMCCPITNPEEVKNNSYIMRMNVTGLTETEINEHIAIFNHKEAHSVVQQNLDGTFPVPIRL